MPTTLTVSTPYKEGGRSIVRAAFDDNLFLLPFTFVPVAAYDTGGNAIATADMPTGYKDLVSVWAFATGPYGFKLDVANKKLMVYCSDAAGATAVQAASSMNLQTVLGSTAITIFFLVR